MRRLTLSQITPIHRLLTPRTSPIQAELISKHAPTAPRIALFGLMISLTACSLFGSGDSEIPLSVEQRTARIAALHAAISQDHETLEALITEPRTDDAPELHENPELETIATRLSQNERELAHLEAGARNEAK